MKTMKKLLCVASALVFSAGAFAQVNATADASATIIAPITITWVADMNFGNVAPSGVAGTVDLATDASRTATNCTVYGGAAAGTVTAAEFTVGGTAGMTYSITLPGAATTISGPGLDMTVDTWISNPTPTGTIGGGGTQTLLVGATLNVGASQTAGSYTSGTPFTVTVNYN
jgi:hypothetical protein